MTATKALFSPIKVGNMLLKHRVVLPPLTRNRATAEAVPSDLTVEYYKQRASEGGFLIAEATFIDRLAGGYPRAPGIYNKEQIEAWKKVTEAVHAKGGYIYSQLWHIGRVGSKYLNPNMEEVVGPSAVSVEGKNMAGQDYEVPHALEIKEIKEIIGQYQQAALNAIEAGFDGVEIHGASGYLPDQFLNSNSNQRTDEYGGSIENRACFVLEALDAVVDAVGPERAAIRFSPGFAFQDMFDETPIETWSYVTAEIQKRHPKLAYVHFIEARLDLMGETTSTESSLDPYRQIWNGPFISSGGYSNATDHAIEMAEKTGNLISFGRTFIANPDLPERLRNGWPLNKYNRATFYSNEAEGYVDYPFYQQEAKN